MINRIKNITLLLGGLVLFSCSKSNDDLASDYHDTVEFFVTGEVNGTPFQRYAGAGYGLITGYELGKEGVVSLKGSLEAASGNKANSFAIILRGSNTLSASGTFDVLSGLDNAPWPYSDPSGQKQRLGWHQLTFIADSSYTTTTYNWSFENGQTALGPEASVNVNENAYPAFGARLSTTSSAGCQSSTTQVVDVTGECRAIMNLSNPRDLDFAASLQAIKGTIANVNWRLNGNAVGSGLVINRKWEFFPDLSPNILEAEIQFQGGCTQTILKEVRVTSPLVVADCNLDFKFEKQPVREYDPLQLGTVEIIFYDSAGKAYTSNYEGVVGSLNFNNVQAYEENENGENTVQFDFSARQLELRHADGSSITLNKVSGEFAVAHP